MSFAVKEFDNVPIHFYIDEQGSFWVNFVDIMTALGFSDPFNAAVNLFHQHKYTLDNLSRMIQVDQGDVPYPFQHKVRFLNKEGAHLVCSIVQKDCEREIARLIQEVFL